MSKEFEGYAKPIIYGLEPLPLEKTNSFIRYTPIHDEVAIYLALFSAE